MHCLGWLSRRRCQPLAARNAAGRYWQCAVAVSHQPAGTAATELSGDAPPSAAPTPWLHSACSQVLRSGTGDSMRQAAWQLLPDMERAPPTWSPAMPALARSFGGQSTASATPPGHENEAQQGVEGSAHATPATRSAAQSGTGEEQVKANQKSQSSSHRGSSLARAGWTRQEVWNAPNAVSTARLVSGPIIAGWIIAGEWHTALIALAVSGIRRLQHHLVNNPYPQLNWCDVRVRPTRIFLQVNAVSHPPFTLSNFKITCD